MTLKIKVVECKTKSGFIWFVGEQNGKGHGDGGYCPGEDDHDCSKECANVLLDHKPLVCRDEEQHDHVDACYEPSVREKIERWFADQEDIKPDAEAPMPKKTIKVKDEKTGKLVDKEVEDREL